MAHAAVSKNEANYGRIHFMVRGRLFKGLNMGTMSIGPIADDERLKMVLPQACCYCASTDFLSVDHLIPTKKGGPNVGDNMVWACRSCNSSKGATDVLQWFANKQTFPPLLLLRRYLKLAIALCSEQGLMNTPLADAPALPVSLSHVPLVYPQPSQLRLWVVELK